MAVLLRKPPSKLEVYNDISGDVVNFFRVLRDNPDELIRKINLTPYAKEEYDNSFEPTGNNIERARRFYISVNMSFNGTHINTPSARGWRITRDASAGTPAPHTFREHDLYAIAERLLTVQIENRDYVDILQRYDNPNTLFYFDPPYTSYTRSKTKRYQFEWDDSEHIKAARILNNLQGMVIVSGYQNDLYDELHKGWTKHNKVAQTNSGGTRIESVWLSPNIASLQPSLL